MFAVPRPRALRALALALPLAVALPACAQGPAPAAEARRAAASAFPPVDSARLLRRLEVLAHDSMEGRRAGTPGSARARRFLLAEMERIGLTPYGEGYERPFRFSEGSRAASGVNLVGYVRGSAAPDRALVVTAHYDHEGVRVGAPGRDSVYNGADDNASGVAALLEAAEYFRANPPRATVIFALLDAEESGLEGAKAFLAAPPVAPGSMIANVNLDMVSQSERGELYLAGTSHYPRLRGILEPVVAAAPVRVLFGHDRPVPSAADDWTQQSDHGVFHARGIPFVYLGVEDHAYYHTPEDEAERVTRPFFVGAARTVIAVIRALDERADELAPRREEAR